MRYYYEKPEEYSVLHGCVHNCDHPLYNSCTLYLMGNFGLAVIQKRFHSKLKVFSYGPIDPWLTDAIFSQAGFSEYFYKHAGECKDGLYPTVGVRQIMYALKMKPLRKEWWSQELQSIE